MTEQQEKYIVKDKFSPENRARYLGGTDAAGVLGLSRYKTPLSVWSEKTGLITPEDISGKLAVKMGTRLEDAVCELFTEETGLKVRRANETIFHPKYPFLGANIDRKIEGQDIILEAKTANGFKGKEWEEDQIPSEYMLQCYHYLAVTGYKKAYIAVLIGGNQDFIVKEILYDKQIIDDIVKKEVHFWNEFVVKKVMPAEIKANDSDTLNKLFPIANETEIQLPDTANQIIESIESLSQDKKLLESTIEKMRNELKAMVKENERGNTGIYTVKWSNCHKDAYMTKPCDYRIIRYKKIEEKGGK